MSKLLIIISFFFILNQAHSQDFYYYKGRRINLEQRSDKFALVLNSSNMEKDNLLINVQNTIGFSEGVKEISSDVYLVSFKVSKSSGEIDNYISSIQGRNSLIKFAAPVYFGESKKVSQIATDEFVVRLRNNSDKEKLDFLNSQNNIHIIGNVIDSKGFLLKSNNGVQKNALELSALYYNSGYFEYAEPNFLYPEYCILDYIPNDQLFPQQWALRNIGQPVPTGSNTNGDLTSDSGLAGADINVTSAWDFTTGSSSIKIGVFDTGIDSTHPDFQAGTITLRHLMAGYDAFYDFNGVPRDSIGHGTCTAGLAGAVINNSIGIAGVAPGCRLMSVKIFNSQGSATDIGIGRAFDTARVRGIDIISNSWNGGTANSVVTDAINNAAINGRDGKGCVILFASGNDGHDSPWFPSYLNNAVAVGGSTPHDQKKAPGTGNQFWWGGNYGANEFGDLDVVAPTVCFTTDNQGGYGYNHNSETEGGVDGNYYNSFNGTSCACPQAAGIAALILSVNSSFTRADVLDKLYRGCDKIDNVSYSTIKPYGRWNDYYGYGRVNAYNSVRLAAGVDVTPPTIVHLNASSISSTYPTRISAEIIDQDGSPLPADSLNRPKLFFRINKNNNVWSLFDSVTASSRSSNVYTFTLPCMGFETQVQYYITARDNAGNESTFPHGAKSRSCLCYYAVGKLTTSSYRMDGFSASDGGVSYSNPVYISDFPILNTNVTLYMRHPSLHEEIIELCSPNGNPNNNKKCLFASNGDHGADISGATVSDSATQFWFAGTPPYLNGLFKGDYLLNGLNGTSAAGNWKILNYDLFLGNAAVYDSVILNFTKTTGVPSPSIRLNSPSDSILNFGSVSRGDSLRKNFYVKNVGTSNLNLYDIVFSGQYASKFSIVNSFPGPVPPNDSGLCVVQLTSNAFNRGKKIPTENDNPLQDAIMTITSNDPSKPNFSVSLESENDLPRFRILSLKTLFQGLYNTSSGKMIRDTVRIYLRTTSSPFTIVDSSKVFLDSTGRGVMTLVNAVNDVNYYIQIQQRNSIDTWSNTPGQKFENDTLNYDFSFAQTQAFGSNMIQIDSAASRFAIYNGDVDQSGEIDLSDFILIFNAAQSFASGYLSADVNGDRVVDLTDLIIAYNNSNNFVTAILPS